MQSLPQASKSAPAATTAGCARAVLDVMPAVMWAIRRQMRQRRADGLSVPQFRTMILLEQNPSACLSAVAEQIGASLPSVSRLVAGLVSNGLLTRKTDASDRRHCCLALTARGQAVLKSAREGTQDYIAREISALSAQERGTIAAGMMLLRGAFNAELNGGEDASLEDGDEIPRPRPRAKKRLKPPVLVTQPE